MAKLLVVDDEPKNLKLIRMFLSGTDHQLQEYSDSHDAWAALQARPDAVDVILLDRMMPNLDGMEFTHRVKADTALRDIPIIMQTAAADSSQVAEGIAAGVFYYLTKPFDQRVLRSLVAAAVEDARQARALRDGLGDFQNFIRCLQRATFTFRTVGEAQDPSRALSSLYPEPKRVVTGLSELMINAVEHGNLEISYREKSELLAANRWSDEIMQRLESARYRDRRAQVDVQVDDAAVTVTIADEGPGFDPAKYLEPDPARLLDSHGRGILIAKTMSFDDLEYSPQGNTVTARCRRS